MRISGIFIPSVAALFTVSSELLIVAASIKIRPEGLITSFSSCANALATMLRHSAVVNIYFFIVILFVKIMSVCVFIS